MKMANARQCYRQPNTVSTVGSVVGFVSSDNGAHSGGSGDGIRYFEDILDNKWQPTPGKTIFFHETSCSKSGIVELNAK